MYSITSAQSRLESSCLMRKEGIICSKGFRSGIFLQPAHANECQVQSTKSSFRGQFITYSIVYFMRIGQDRNSHEERHLSGFQDLEQCLQLQFSDAKEYAATRTSDMQKHNLSRRCFPSEAKNELGKKKKRVTP